MSFAEYSVEGVRFHTGWHSLSGYSDAAPPIGPISVVAPGRSETSDNPALARQRERLRQDLQWQKKPHPVFIAREIMHSPAITIRLDLPLSQALKIFRDQGFGHLPVFDMQGKPVGLISQHDVMEMLIREEKSIGELNSIIVADKMSTPLLACHPDADIREVARVLVSRRIGSLAVIDEGHLLGMITRTDLLRALIEHPSLQLLV